jgi:hypothetical protein
MGDKVVKIKNRPPKAFVILVKKFDHIPADTEPIIKVPRDIRFAFSI